MDSLNENTKRKVAFYIRVSTERQAKVEEGSLKNQKQMLQAELERRNAQKKDWGVFVKAYVDEGISGKDTNRPAFQQMLVDIEIGRIDTVMFTELSRLSRSLKDFLNIFEFVRRHNCDLICLKTNIDTTSPYQELVTKILMVFAEFEREMTSRRTSLNAYERSKRGLANGGLTILGYQRDKKKKGYLIVDEKESEVVQAIFKTYAKERSIRCTTDLIKKRYEGLTPKLKKITPSRVYGILTNKAYIGIRIINKRDKEGYEEVKAVWEPIIEKKLFEKAQRILQENRDRYHARGTHYYNYFFSGLLRCGKCGEKLQGKSAYSTTGKRHYYYSHKSICPEGGLNRIDAEITQGLVFDWLRDIEKSGDKFQQLEEQGRERITQKIDFLQDSLKELETEEADIKKQIDTRIQELTKAKSEVVRDSIEKSIIELEQGRKENDEKRLSVYASISELENLTSKNESLFGEYRSWIHSVMKKPANLQKKGLKELISSLILQETQIKVALSGVNLKEPISAVFASSPLIGPISNILLHSQDRKYTQFPRCLKSSSHTLLLDQNVEHLIVDIIPIIKPKRGRKPVAKKIVLP